MPAFWSAQGRPKPLKLVGCTRQHFGAPEGAKRLRCWYSLHASILGHLRAPKGYAAGMPHMPVLWGVWGSPKPP